MRFLSAVVALAVTTLGARAEAGAIPTWNVGEARAGQRTIYNRTRGGALLGFPLAAGDMDGDGRADLILTPMNASSGPNRDRSGSGEAVILLTRDAIAGERDLAELDVNALPADVLIVYGADRNDYFGTQVTVADLDGDGFADAIIGAQYGDGADNLRSNSGEVVIVWGRASLGGRVIDLADPPPGAVTFVYGAAAGDRLGAWVSNADVDSDGIADAILGADEANPGGDRPEAGTTYVLYGGNALRILATIDLAAPAVPITAINGIDHGDHSGATVRGFDLDGDGAAEVLIGAGLNRLSAQIGPTGNLDGHGSGGGDGPNNICDPIHLECDIGEAYIVWGQRGERPASIELSNPPPSTTIIYGIDRGDAYGEELYAGDFNGDGFGDVAIGAITADGPQNARPSAGELALILGGPTLRGAVIELANPPSNVTFFEGARPGAIAGDTIMLLDVDGDGRDELVIACPDDQPTGRVQAGVTFVFFGTADPLPASVDLAAIPPQFTVLKIDGNDASDMLAYSMGQGDLNGDGRPDLVLNAMGGDGFMNGLTDAGDAYVFDAVAVTQAVGREIVATRTATATPTVTPTAIATPTSTARPCAGDCDGNGAVSIDELISAVRIALGEAPASSCRAVDGDGSGTVEIGELITAVERTLSGC